MFYEEKTQETALSDFIKNLIKRLLIITCVISASAISFCYIMSL